MKSYKSVVSFFAVFMALAMSFVATQAQASITPTISLSIVDTSSSQLTVHGDPNASIQLYYGPSATASRTIGSTDENGNFSMVMSSDSYDLSACSQTAYVVVDGQQSPTINWSSGDTSSSCTTNSSSYPSFSQNNVIIGVGQNLAITMIGNGGYYISSNSNSSIITASLNSNIVNLYANSFGGSNINICESDGQCNTLYVVAVNSSVVQTSTTNMPAAISSLTVSSNNANGYFIGTGAVLSFSFSANQAISNISVLVNGTQVGVSGNGNGPYTASYTITSGQTLPVPVVINFLNLAGTATQTTFALGGTSVPAVVNSTPATVTAPAVAQVAAPSASTSASTTALSGDGYVFADFLNVGSTGNEVVELQKRLTTLGFYTGPQNGNFGPLTEAAVKSFQNYHGITQAGYVGPSTRSALNQP